MKYADNNDSGLRFADRPTPFESFTVQVIGSKGVFCVIAEAWLRIVLIEVNR